MTTHGEKQSEGSKKEEETQAVKVATSRPSFHEQDDDLRGVTRVRRGQKELQTKRGKKYVVWTAKEAKNNGRRQGAVVNQTKRRQN